MRITASPPRTIPMIVPSEDFRDVEAGVEAKAEADAEVLVEDVVKDTVDVDCCESTSTLI